MPVTRYSRGVERLELLATKVSEKSWVMSARSMAKAARTAPARISQV